jgi:hypothetical protein
VALASFSIGVIRGIIFLALASYRWHYPSDPSLVSVALSVSLSVWPSLQVQHKTKFHDKPMSGWFSVLFMMQTCESLVRPGVIPFNMIG